MVANDLAEQVKNYSDDYLCGNTNEGKYYRTKCLFCNGLFYRLKYWIQTAIKKKKRTNSEDITPL